MRRGGGGSSGVLGCSLGAPQGFRPPWGGLGSPLRQFRAPQDGAGWVEVAQDPPHCVWLGVPIGALGCHCHPPPPPIWGSVSLQPVWGGAPVTVRQFKWVPEEAPPTLYFWGALTYFLIVLLPGLGVVGLAGGGGLGGLPLDGGGGGGGRLPRHRPRWLLVVVRVVGGPGGVGVRRRRRFAWGGPQKKNKG